MQHILQWIFVFAAALASVFTLQSCGLEEPFPGPQSGISEGSVEFVVRPVSFNDHDVATKADGDPATFEDDEIYNAFLLVFNQDGQRLLCEEIRLNAEDGGLSAKVDRSLGNVTACVLANVPADFARSITGRDILNSAVLDLTYDSSKSGILGVPVLDLDNDSSTPAVACIPMFGQSSEPIDLSNYTAPYQIFIKRLFAKATVSLKMNLTNSGSGMQANSYMQMVSYSLCDLPYKVKLTEPTENDYESAWVKNTGTVSVCQSNSKIYNQAANGYITNLPKELVFHCYVPEYYLLPKSTSTTGFGEEYKPLMYDDTKHPIYIQLVGSYEPVSGVSQNLIYKIYLGENNATSFTLKRNTHYTNYLVIKGVENHKDGESGKIDYRVEISQGDVVSMYGEVANCYMIGKEGTYNFPAYKGAYKYAQLKDAPKCTSKNAKILIKDNDGIWLKNENISVATDELTQEQIITIKVTNGDNTEGEDITIGASGNAILALCDDDGNIEWSWHLWFTGGLNLNVANMGLFEMDTQAYPNGFQMMDRNLGSNPTAVQSTTPGVATGLYYKYGDKNPYIGGGYIEGGTYGNLTWNPSDDANKEDNTKAVNDPCPPGYYVPSSTVWKGFTPTKENADNQNAFIYWKENTGDINLLDDIYVYYPYAGYLENGTGQSSGTVTVPLEYNDELLYETNLFNVYRAYKDIKYTINVTSTFGMLCGSDEALRYDVSTTDSGSWLTSDFTVTAVTWYKGTRKKVGGSLWNPVYEITYDYNTPYTLADITGAEQANWITAKSTVIDPKLKEATKAYSYAAVDFPAINSSYGYQVRCVKE